MCASPERVKSDAIDRTRERSEAVHAMHGVPELGAGTSLTGPRLAYRGAIGAGREPLSGGLDPRPRTGDFKYKLSPDRFFEIGAVTNGDHESSWPPITQPL